MLAKWLVLCLQEELCFLYAFAFKDVLQELREGCFKLLHSKRVNPAQSSNEHAVGYFPVNENLPLPANPRPKVYASALKRETYWRTAAWTTMLLATTAGSSFETNAVGKRLRTSAPMQLSSEAHSMKANNRLATSGTSCTNIHHKCG